VGGVVGDLQSYFGFRKHHPVTPQTPNEYAKQTLFRDPVWPAKVAEGFRRWHMKPLPEWTQQLKDCTLFPREWVALAIHSRGRELEDEWVDAQSAVDYGVRVGSSPQAMAPRRERLARAWKKLQDFVSFWTPLLNQAKYAVGVPDNR
jgi:hypothetical protein